MILKFNAKGPKRKELAGLISRFTGNECRYLGAPGFSYEIGRFVVDRNGNVQTDYEPGSETVEQLTEMLYDNGFVTEYDESRGYDLEVSVPREALTDGQIENLRKLIAKKAELIKKAFGAEELPVVVTDERIIFPWFGKADPATAGTYTVFITKLCALAKNAVRINDGGKPVENEKYAFRCFLLRLGFIGDDYKADRKILLKNLDGSSAFKSPKAKEEEPCSE
nr:MAG TPA: Putative amidoligase enzyme [Caudoviricetes sp.]